MVGKGMRSTAIKDEQLEVHKQSQDMYSCTRSIHTEHHSTALPAPTMVNIHRNGCFLQLQQVYRVQSPVLG